MDRETLAVFLRLQEEEDHHLIMEAGNFTLPEDMTFGQAQVIAISAYR